MKDRRQEFLKKWMDLINPNEDGTQAIYNAMAEYAKDQSISFFEWMVENEDGKKRTLSELYNKFLKSNELQ